MTTRFAAEAGRLGVGKPAPGRVPFVVTYFWEAQDRDRWPMAYPATRSAFERYGLSVSKGDPAESYLALRDAVLELCSTLHADVWDIEALAWTLRPTKPPKPPKPTEPKAAGESEPAQSGVPDIYAAYRNSKLIFRARGHYAVLPVSLWTKPFVILTGISGTGKTRIAQGLAQLLEPGTDEAPDVLELEPGDETQASFRITEWALKSGRLYLGLDQLPAFDVPDRGESSRIEVTLPNGAAGTLRLNNIDLSATTSELRLLFANAALLKWLREEARPGDVLLLEFEDRSKARATISHAEGTHAPKRRLFSSQSVRTGTIRAPSWVLESHHFSV